VAIFSKGKLWKPPESKAVAKHTQESLEERGAAELRKILSLLTNLRVRRTTKKAVLIKAILTAQEKS
jgi:hypothetical protein